MIKKATFLEQSLVNTRKHWLEAREKKDVLMMKLWEKVGNSIKRRMVENLDINAPATFEEAKEIFNS
jgi:hypothetical protein